MDTIQQLQTFIRDGGFAWPGGYPCYALTSDGAALSVDAVKDNYRIIRESMRDDSNDGWRVVAIDINYEDPNLYCDHTGERIESAYCED